MLGKGARCARALSLFLTPACFPRGLFLAPRLQFSLRISVGHLGSGVTDGLRRAAEKSGVAGRAKRTKKIAKRAKKVPGVNGAVVTAADLTGAIYNVRHAAIFLLTKYKQRLKREAPVQREVARWTDQSVAALQDALDDADWDMFRRSTDDVSEFTEAVVGFIGKLVDDTIPRITIKKFSNQKPWVDRTIREALNSRTAAYNAGIISGNMDEYKSAAYGVRRAVREAKRRYGKKLETQFQQSGSRSLWQGLRMITDYRSPPSGLMSADESLANELNTFFARFEATSSSANASSTNANGASANSANANGANANGASANGTIGAANGTCAGPTIEQRPLIITESDVRRVFKRVNTRKARGPDGICGRVLKACADQLAPVFTDIFNLSLTLSIVPSSFKRSTIVPIPKKPRPSDLNDYRPVALTSVVMKCFEKLVRDFITSSLPASTDPLQFAYRHICSTLH
ncbi:hypothetical protein P4O66_019071 [Electrophorus voltai]|uniref:Reverse transcriptase domain-containing protein n=1 Tax=Electrophorus voltai TaxID=2609070 RepID=A0AAD8YU21_9TELE|nr:hypothetical protein P4O66_019071 [Electrophorus voltai]